MERTVKGERLPFQKKGPLDGFSKNLPDFLLEPQPTFHRVYGIIEQGLRNLLFQRAVVP